MPLPRWLDKRSIRTIKTRKGNLLIGCPKGKWMPRKKRCLVGTRAFEMRRKKRKQYRARFKLSRAAWKRLLRKHGLKGALKARRAMKKSFPARHRAKLWKATRAIAKRTRARWKRQDKRKRGR